MARARGIVVVAAWAALAGVAVAAPEPDPMAAKVAELEAAIAEHAASDAGSDLMGDAKRAAALYAENAGKAPWRDRILKAIGGLVRHKEDAVARAAVAALGETGDLDAAKYLRPLLRPVDDRVPAALDAAFEAIPKVPHESLVDPLLAIVDDSKNYAAAAKALTALGGFGRLKGKRERILEAVAKSVQRSRPGQGSPNASKKNEVNPGAGVGVASRSESARFDALTAVVPDALNRLTGQVVTSAEEWFEVVKRNKGKLGDVFVEPAGK